jgi:tRNA threonylcarbamoyladenosine biosynthesis protein TsaB
MLIAAIDTSTIAVSVALADADGLVARFDAPRVRRHAETVLPALDAVLTLVGRTRREITHLCVDVGPGMFTGLRVGVTTTITLAMAFDLPVVSVGSLDLLAWRVALGGAHRGTVGAVLDARRKECFVQPFAVKPGEVPLPLAPAAALPPSLAAELLRRHGCSGVIGDGPVAYPEPFAGFAVLEPKYPDAATAAIVAVRILDSATSADQVSLRYLREPDAEIPKDLRP